MGFVISLTSALLKSSIFWLAIITALPFLRTRFMAFRMYSMAVMLVKNRYSSSINAAVFPLDSRASDIKERTLNSIAFRIAVSASVMPFVPKQINRLLVMLVCPLKNLLSAPIQIDFNFKHKSLTVSLV